ncbi:MAG TPA: hypothetical protein VGK59_06985, partial [Ohtaekwangia sp.]
FFEVYRPKRLITLFKRIKKLDLSEFGLQLNESEKNFSGYYKDYFLTVLADSSVSDGEWVRINAFIVPNETQHEIYKKFIERKLDFTSEDDLYWFTKKTKMKFGRCPDVERLRNDINDLVDALRFERVEPMRFRE